MGGRVLSATSGEMKVAILAGGRGSRLGGAHGSPPKPLSTIGGRPVLWHVLQLYRRQEFNDFVIALGHRGDEVVAWFRGLAAADRRLALYLDRAPSAPVEAGDWRVQLVRTGERTANGSRLLRLEPWLQDGTFFLSWCDGLADLDFRHLLAYHRSHGKMATVVAVHPPSRFGRLELVGDDVVRFQEKPPLVSEWISGGFFALEPSVLLELSRENCSFERGPLPQLAAKGELRAYRHESFWACLDTPADREDLEALWQSGRPPWQPGEVAA